MNFPFQSTGKINLYNAESQQGTQPVRVIHRMVLFMFQNSHPDFYNELLEEIKAGKLHQELKLVFAEEPILISPGYLRTPRVNQATKAIEIHETFLSYLWCCCYSIYAQYLHKIDFPKVNEEHGREIHVVDQAVIDKAQDLLNYTNDLIIDFTPWDKENLPNPEKYDAESSNLVEQTNLFYTEAVKFILCHEFTHLKLHIDILSLETPDYKIFEFEEEADNNAIDIMMRGLLPTSHSLAVSRNLTIEVGIVLGFLSMLYLSAKTSSRKHPNTEDRLTNALQRLNLSDGHFCWGIACIGLQLWNDKFDLFLNWDKTQSYRNQYFEIVNQIKNRS